MHYKCKNPQQAAQKNREKQTNAERAYINNSRLSHTPSSMFTVCAYKSSQCFLLSVHLYIDVCMCTYRMLLPMVLRELPT